MTTVRATVLLATLFVPLAALGGWLVGSDRPAYVPEPGATPAACIRALDLAAEGFAAASDATDAARRGDRDALDDANERLEDLAPDAGEANRACRRGE